MKTFTKALALLLTLTVICSAMSLTAFAQSADPYGLIIAGVTVTEDNASSITGEGIDGSVSFNPETKTLSLCNARITKSSVLFDSESSPVFYTGLSDLTVEVSGANEIISSDSELCNVYGVFAEGGSLRIESAPGSEGKLTITSGNCDVVQIGTAYGIYVSDNLTVDGCVLDVCAGTADFESIGLYVNNKLTLVNSTDITATAGAAFVSCGIYVCADDDRDKTGFDAKGSRITATSGAAEDNSSGIFVHPTKDYVADDCVVSCLSSTSQFRSYGIAARDCTVTGGSCTLTAGSSPISEGILAVQTLAVSGGSRITSITDPVEGRGIEAKTVTVSRSVLSSQGGACAFYGTEKITSSNILIAVNSAPSHDGSKLWNRISPLSGYRYVGFGIRADKSIIRVIIEAVVSLIVRAISAMRNLFAGK